MANSDKNIRIITNKNKSGLPNITFTGYNNDPIVLNVLDDNSISFEGSSGQLFSVSNSVTSGTIFSVNDISGIPSFRVDADGTVGIAEFSGNVGIGILSPQSKLSVGGDINAGAGYSYRINGAMIMNSSSLGTGITLSSLTSVGTVTSGTWSASPISLLYGGTGASTAAQALANLGAAAAGTNADITRLTNLQSLLVTIPAAASIGITVKAAASQTGNYLQFTTSADALLSWITKDGTFAHGAYFTHNDGRVPGISVQRSNAAGIVARGYNSDTYAAVEVQNNPGSLTVGLYPSGLVYGGVLQAYATTGSTNTTTGSLIVAGGAGIAGSLNTSTSFTSSVSGLNILNGSLSASTGTIAATSKLQISVSDTAAFAVKNVGGTSILNVDTSNSVVSVLPSTGSTNTSTGSLVVTGGVGIGGTANIRSTYVYNDLLHIPGTGNTFGQNWTNITLPTGFTNSGLNVIYAENKFVATGGSVVAYSDDLINWTTSYIPWNTSVYNQSITYGNGVYVVTSSTNSYVAYSRDLSTWTLASVTYQNYQTAAYGNGRFVVNAGSVVGISTNGVNWASITPTGSQPNYQSLKFNNGYFYSSGSRSIDGIFWEPLNISVSVKDITYGNGVYFGAQYNSANYAYSYDGVNFTAATIENNVYLGGEYQNGVYYLRTQHNNAYIYYSFDGINYQKVGSPGPTIAINTMAFGKNKIVVFGQTGGGVAYGYFTEGTNGKIDLNPIREGNLDNTFIGKRIPKPANFTDISANGYVNIVNQAASGSSISGALVVRGGVGIGASLNVGGNIVAGNSLLNLPTAGGIAGTWTAYSNSFPTPSQINDVIYANKLYVGVGYSAVSSIDGVSWTLRSTPYDLSYVGFGNSIFSAVLFNSALGATSLNGTTWTANSLPNSRGWTGIAFGNDRFVTIARNSNIAAVSNNGYNWTEVTLPVSYAWVDIVFGNGYFVAVANSSNIFVYSPDGYNWRTGTLLSSSGWNSIAYGDGVFYVTGSSTVGNYSRDLINWTSRSHVATGSALNAYTNGAFVVADASNFQSSVFTNNLLNINNVNYVGPTSYIGWVVGGEDKFIAGSGATFYTYAIPFNTTSLHPFNTGEINNVRIGAKKPSSASFTGLNASGLVAFGASYSSSSPYTGSFVVTGGVGIGGTINLAGTINAGLMPAPTISNLAGIAGTGALTPSTTYYYKLSAIDNFGNESVPSQEYSVTLNSTSYGTQFYINYVPGAAGYKLYRTTTSGDYTGKFVQTYRYRNESQTYYQYDLGRAVSAGTPVTSSAAYSITTAINNNTPTTSLPNLVLPNGRLQIQSPNTSFANSFTSTENIGLELGETDALFIRNPFSLNSVTAGTGGSLTPGTTYYYVYTMVDFYGNESLPSREYALTANSGGAAIFNHSVVGNYIPAIRRYRTTTSGNYTNSYIGENVNDYGQPTQNVSPPTSTRMASARIVTSSSFYNYSYLQNLDVAPGDRNGAYRKLGSPYSFASGISITTSGAGGSLLPNTTYYYKIVDRDIYGSSSYPSAEYSIGTGTSTAITINGSHNGWIERRNHVMIFRSTTQGNYSNVPYYFASLPFTDYGDPAPTSSVSNSHGAHLAHIGRVSVSGPTSYTRDLMIGPPTNGTSMWIYSGLPGFASISAASGGTLVSGQIYYYVMVAFDANGQASQASYPVRFVAGAGGAAQITQYSVNNFSNNFQIYHIYRTTTLASWTNTLIASNVKGTTFTDLNYPTSSGTPDFGSYPNSALMTLGNINSTGNAIIPRVTSQAVVQVMTSPSSPYRTGGNSAGNLTTSTTYYYIVAPYGGQFDLQGIPSDEFSYTTSATEKNITLSLGGHKLGAQSYRIWRSTTRGNYGSAYYFETSHINFTDYGFGSATGSIPSLGIQLPNQAESAQRIDQTTGNFLVNTTFVGQSGRVRQLLKSANTLSVSSGTGGTLANNTDYFYVVVAFDQFNNFSFPSEEAWINTGSNNSVTITWAPVQGASYYKVYRSTSSGAYTNTLIANYVNDRTFTDLNYPTTSGTPMNNASNNRTSIGSLFDFDNSKNYSLLPRFIIQGVDSSYSAWNTDFSVRLSSNPVGLASAAVLQVGAGFTFNSSAGFNGTTYGTQIAIGAATGFTGSLLDAQLAGSSKFKVNFDGATIITSTTDSTSTSSGALIVSGGVGVGGTIRAGGSIRTSYTGTSPALDIASRVQVGTENNFEGLNINSNYSYAFNVQDKANNNRFTIDVGNNRTLFYGNTSSHEIRFYNSNQSSYTGFVAASSGTTTYTWPSGSPGIGNSVLVSSLSGALSWVPVSIDNSGNTSIKGGLGVSGVLTFSRASFGYTGVTFNPTMSFIGNTTSSPITLTVLTDNSLSWEGTSGQLFAIDNNLTTGEIFAVSDISGLPIISASAGQTVSMNEFGGYTRIGNGSVSSTGASNLGADGALVVYGGVGITGNANIGGTVRITNTTASTSATSGALTIAGGLGVNSSVYINGITNSGTNTFNKSGYNTGDILLDNGSVDTPGILFYWRNNNNFGIDTFSSGAGSTRFRIVKELNESGGAEVWSVNREGIVTQTAWDVGETINTRMYNYSDLGMSATTTISATSYTTFATITYTPKSATSYLWIEFSCTYAVAGTSADDHWSNIEVNGSEIVNANQVWANATGGGTRSGVLFPLAGRYTNTGTAGIAISIRAKRGTSDDNNVIYGNSGSGYMRIQEIGR